MNVVGTVKKVALGLALTVGAAGAIAGTCVPDPYTAPGGFSGFFSSAGGDSCAFEFDVLSSGSYDIELTPSPAATSGGWSANVAGVGVLTPDANKLVGTFNFVTGVTYVLNILTPGGTSASGYSVSGVMVPVPGTLALLGLGLVGLGAARRKTA
jgi:PEP-CTERM motif